MDYIPKNIQGIEGDDIPYHLSLLGLDVNDLPKDIIFYPLNDHYNTHGVNWTVDTNSARTVVFYDLVNTTDFDHTRFCKFIANYNHPNKVYLTVNQSPRLQINDVKIIPWDFMWNRFRAYYNESIPETLYLHHYAYGQYHLPTLDFITPRSKTFLSMLGREYGYRANLYNFVSQYRDRGYISNRTRGEFLEDAPVTGAFTPPDNKFYNDSYISIYVESNCTAIDLIHITEKTFEPLAKGHIILPFSNPGTIARLKELGFMFPPFVNYDFDNIDDPNERLRQLEREFNRLLNINIQELYSDYQDYFIYNQRHVKLAEYDNRIKEIFDV